MKHSVVAKWCKTHVNCKHALANIYPEEVDIHNACALYVQGDEGALYCTWGLNTLSRTLRGSKDNDVSPPLGALSPRCYVCIRFVVYRMYLIMAEI